MRKPTNAVMLIAPAVPGAVPSVAGKYKTVDDAYQAGVEKFGGRRDLRRQDVRLMVGARCIGYAGPSR